MLNPACVYVCDSIFTFTGVSSQNGASRASLGWFPCEDGGVFRHEALMAWPMDQVYTHTQSMK